MWRFFEEGLPKTTQKPHKPRENRRNGETRPAVLL